jgi:cytochrome bd-type quinol oxidase subunit 2
MPPVLLRLAYVSEFLLALIAALMLWSQVGGQAHLDLMPWYDKLSLSVALAVVTVLGTMAAAAHERAWNARTVAFLLMALLIAGAMAALTYYYHVHEDDDEGGGDSNVAVVSVKAPLPYGRGSVGRCKTPIPSRARQQAVELRA